MPDLVAARDDDRVRFLAPAENRCLTGFCHDFPTPALNAAITHY
jgi:hypothetical protein